MKLFSYDHCPYCVKARMIFGLKNVPFELETLLNDDEETPIKMIGQKMLPILAKDDGQFMPESLDIIAYIDSLSEFGDKVVGESQNSEALNQWLKDTRAYHYRLAMPRWPQMDLEEFATESARAYFTRKKENSIGPFSENIARTNELVEQANNHLQVLEEIIVSSPYFWGDQLSIDDFHVFASLRVLTTTQGVVFPKKIQAYMQSISAECKVSLHWEKALK